MYIVRGGTHFFHNLGEGALEAGIYVEVDSRFTSIKSIKNKTHTIVINVQSEQQKNIPLFGQLSRIHPDAKPAPSLICFPFTQLFLF